VGRGGRQFARREFLLLAACLEISGPRPGQIGVAWTYGPRVVFAPSALWLPLWRGARESSAAMPPSTSLPSTARALPIGRVETDAAGLELSFHMGLVNGLLLCTPFWAGAVGLIAGWWT
jgi:hypothetical protein